MNSITQSNRYLPHELSTKIHAVTLYRQAKSVKFVCRRYHISKQKFYQYTMLDEASRERFLYAYEEQSSYSTVDFVQRAILYFGYAPETIQTDNGAEFTHLAKT